MLQFIRRRHPIEKVESVLASAGFGAPTPLQREYVPAALHGRDLIVECTSGEGKTIAQLLPYLFRPRGRRKAPSILILIDSAEEAKKFRIELNRLPVDRTRDGSVAILGTNAQVKADLQLLAKRPGIIVGTTERIIDHIRRNNLLFSGDTMIVANLPQKEDHTKFDLDVEFIFTKSPPEVQKVVFSPSAIEADSLASLLKRPVLLSSDNRTSVMPPLHLYTVEKRSPELLTDLVLGTDFKRFLIITDSAESAGELDRTLSRRGFSCCSSPPDLQRKLDGENLFQCTLTTFRDFPHIPLSYDSILFYGLPQGDTLPGNILFQKIGTAVATHTPPPVFSILLSRGERENFERQQEYSKMKTKDETFPEKEEVMKGRLQQIIQAIKEDENPDVLNSYKKLIRKTVPLHMRGYVIAYLFKQSITGDAPRGRAPRGDKKSPMQTIFISIGKNRRVFPRDLVKLFRKTLNLGQHEIGSVKVLDNYSFIDIPQYVAQKAIDTMDGIDFHGRNITVNFARKKKGENNDKS